MKEKVKKQSNILLLLTGFLMAIVTINIIFILLTVNDAKTVDLLKKENILLSQDKQIIVTAGDISSQYKSEIDLISKVFPNEESIPQFIQEMEQVVSTQSDDYSLKFNSLTPIAEQDKLYLLVTLTMKTDMERLLILFDKLEDLPYMTHVTAVDAKPPTGFVGKGEVSIQLKLYVQNPFSTK